MEKILVITPSRCVGCLNCELACSCRSWNDYFPAPPKIGLCFFADGAKVPVTCFQCEKAPCLGVCKTGAIHRDNESGVVEVAAEKCIGCRMCVMACPFGNISYSRAAGMALKCDQCGGSPRCAAACPSRAIEYVPAGEDNLERRRAFAALLKETPQ